MSGSQRSRVLVLCAVTAIAFLLGEIALRITLPSHYYVWPPHLHQVFRPYEEAMPGIRGTSEFITNATGIRGDELLATHTYRILAVGGSTTECLYLDQRETWPHLLQQALNDHAADQHVWVGNVGMSGRSTRHHITAIQYLPLTEMKIDVIVLLAGINDLSRRLSQDTAYDPDYLSRPQAAKTLLFETFSGGNQPYPDADLFFKKTATWRLIKQVAMLASKDGVQDESGRIYLVWREHRRAAREIRARLPDLDAARSEYRRNIDRIIDLARERSIRVILLTQPTMWKTDLPERLSSLLWFGGVGDFQKERGNPYYSIEALERGMRDYNDTLLAVCRERQVECVDLAASLPKDTTVFYDDAHFNESGARKTAAILADYLLTHRQAS